LALVLFLGACAADPLTINRVPREPGGIDQVTVAPAAPEKATPSVDQAKPDMPAALEPEPQVAAFSIDPEKFKQSLIGLDADGVTGLMGAPDFERAERPAKIWQYRSATCVVDVFLFDNKGKSEVAHVAVRGRKVRNIDEKSCFASILSDTDTIAPDSKPKPKPMGPVNAKAVPAAPEPEPAPAAEPEPVPEPEPEPEAATEKPKTKAAIADPVFEQPGLPNSR